MIFHKHRNQIAIFTASVLAVLLFGCGAGAPSIPADLPAPKKMGGPGPDAMKLEEIAKQKGLTAPAPTSGHDRARGFNPTNTNP